MKKIILFILSFICFTSCNNSVDNIPNDYSILSMSINNDVMELVIGFKNESGYPCHKIINLKKDTTIVMNDHNYDIYLDKTINFSLAIHNKKCK